MNNNFNNNELFQNLYDFVSALIRNSVHICTQSNLLARKKKQI